MHKNSSIILAGLATASLALGISQVNAADFSEECCADLEERVSELEATTAQKGNRVVSLAISGQVSRALLFWDDGINSDTYVVDNALATSRFGFDGKAQIAPGVTAGFLMQIDINDSLSSIVSQEDPPGPAPGGDEGFGESSIRLRLSNVYIASERLGRVSIGQNYPFIDAVGVPFQLGNTINTDGGPYADGFSLMTSDGVNAGFSWGQLIGNGPRRNDYLRYDSPVFGGLSFSGLIGDDDIWEVGAKYFATLDRIRLHTAIAHYNYDAEPLGSAGRLSDFAETKGLVSVKDLPTGLFLTLWAGAREYERNGIEDSGNSFQALLGVENNFIGYGNTTIYGGYGRFQDFASTGLLVTDGAVANDDAVVTGSDVDRVTLGIVQTFDAAALDIYAIAEHYSADVSTTGGDADLEDYNALIVGSRIKF